MNTIQLAIFSSEAVIIALLMLFLFRMRSRFGLSPLYITLGVFQPVQTILVSSVYVEILPGVIVSPGSVIMFTASLFVILLVYIFEDALETRKAIYGIMFANLAMALLLFIFGIQLELLRTINFLNLSPEILNRTARIMLTGTIVLFADSVLLIFVYETIWRLITRNLFLRIYLTIALILIFDSLAFTAAAFYGQPDYVTILTSGIIGKLFMAAFYALALTVYLRFAESTDHKTQPFQDIFHILSYRQKFEIAHQRSSQAEQVVQEQQRMISAIADTTPAIIYVYDMEAQGNVYSNSGIERILGYQPQEIRGMGSQLFPNLIHPDDLPQVIAFQTKYLAAADNDILEVEYRMKHRDGGWRYLHSYESPFLRNEDGIVKQTIGIAIDVTERRRAESLLRESEGKYQTLAKISPVGIFRTDTNGITTYVNPTWCEISGVPFDNALGDGWLDAVHPDDREKVSRDWQESTQSREESSSEYRFIRPNRTIAWVMGRAVPEMNSENQIVGYVGTITDITERKQAEEQAQRQLQRLEALHRIDMAITSGLEMNVSLGLLLEQLLSILGVDAAAILLLEPHTRLLRYTVSRGFRTNGIQYTQLPLGRGHAGRAALERRVIHIHDLANNLDELVRSSSLTNEGFKSYFVIPLIAKGQVKGVLEAFHRSSLNPDHEWINFTEAMANQAAITIEDAQLVNELQRSNLELAISYDATIEGWSRALDLRDKETEGHTQRVTEKTLALARLMGLPEEELIHIRRGALLHDIGKMGVPDGILFKPGSLTGAEWEIMRKHTTFAYEMLSPIRYLKSAGIDIPYCHHERWDGTGYPRGLMGEQIPLAARIFAVVDVWDAITSDRPYRSAWSKEKAMEYIKEQSGKHFDPQVVNVFLRFIS